ncbi:hypothetical protein [Gracilibacillus dipsosauri]|uniref:hypothetical protein n=1 Tax=Gracilibacillus dipsosauri TaxID=178340 RepID=UPI00240A9050
MSWFKELTGYSKHMKYREKNPNAFVEKYGTNKHPDHSKVLSDDLIVNQNLIDTLFYQITSLLPSKSLSLPQLIEIHFDNEWLEHTDRDGLIIGRYLPYNLLQNREFLRKGRIRLTNLGDRGEPASVYDDAFSRFLIIESMNHELAKTNKFDDLTQYGFHKFLNAKYEKLLPEYKILGVKKELRSKILYILQANFKLKVSGEYVILPEIKINKNNDKELLNFIKHLFVVGLVKEFTRGRLAELTINK